MKNGLLFRAKTISRSTRCSHKPSTLLQAAKHNARESQAEYGSRAHINPSLSSSNKVLHGPSTSAEIVEIARSLKKRHLLSPRNLRKDHVQALEFVISLPINTSVDLMSYFEASTNWLMQVFGREFVLSVIMHVDEQAPHIHALVLPITNGHYDGGAPIKPTRLRMLVEDFAEVVGKPFGLTFERKPRISAYERNTIANGVINHLVTRSDPVVSSSIWPVVEEHIKQDPQYYQEHLGIEFEHKRRSKKLKSMAKIFTGTGRKTSEDRLHATRNLSSVGFSQLHSQSEPPFPNGVGA